MAIFESDNFGKSILSPQSAGEVYVSDDRVTLPDTLTVGDLVKIGYLPADCIPIDLVVRTQELDVHATDTLRLTIGLLNAAEDDLVASSDLITGAQAEAVKTIRGDGVGFLAITRDKVNDRILAIKVTAAAETAAAGIIRAILSFRTSDYGV